MVKETLKWFHQIVFSKDSFRKEVKRAVLKALRSYSEDGEGQKNTIAGETLVNTLEDSKEFVFVGFVPRISYAKEAIHHKNDELQAQYVHPFGTATLVYCSKKLPILIITNPGIRWDKSFLKDMKFNKDQLLSELEGNGIFG